MANSQEMLQETVFQLLSHHQSIDRTLSEVSSLRQTCKDKNTFALLSDFGFLPLLKSHDRQSDSQGCLADVYINRFLSLSAIDQLSDDKKAELDTVLLMLKHLKQTDKLSTANLKDSLMEYPRIPLHVLWTLHKEGIFSLENFLIMQKGQANTSETFLSMMWQARDHGQQDVISGILSELLYLGFSEGKRGKVQKTASDTVDGFILGFVDDTLKNNDSKEGVISLSCAQLDTDSLKRVFTHLLTVILSHRPVMKVSQAIREQNRWAYGKISPLLTHLFKQFLLLFEVAEILTLLRQVLEQQEVNWQLLLSFVSVTTVCLPETAKLYLEFTDRLLQEGLESCEIETTIMGILLARQACFQGPHVYLSYTDWFQRTFSDGSRSLASHRKSFTFLMKFLTDLVPYETAEHIKVHILHPPFVPPKCRPILTDYIILAKTRLEDLKESLDLLDVENRSSSANDKGKLPLVSEIQSTVELFEMTGKIPTSILEASIFRKPYYIGQFLPALLQPRPLPDVPDCKMRLIATLKRADKIPPFMYTSYEKGCKRETSQLLEGVFIDSDSEDDMALSPFEQMANTLQQLKNTVKNKTGKNTSKHTVSEVLSMLCEKIENVLSVSSQGHLPSAAYVTIDTQSIKIDSLQLKVIDALLNTISQILQECYTDNNTDFTWLSKLVQSFSQYRVVIETMYKRIFTLIIKQGISLENHHIDCIAAVLVEIQFLGEKLPWLQLHCKGQGHSREKEKTTLTECIFDMLPVTTSGWMGLTLRLTTSYLKYMFCVHVDIDQCLVLPKLVKKFSFLSTRQIMQLRNLSNTGDGIGDGDIVSAVYTSEVFQNLMNVFPLTVSDWVDYELSVCPEDDILTDFQRYEYFTWIVYRYFLAKGQGDYYSVASAVLSGLLKNGIRIYKSLEECSCSCDGIAIPASNSWSYLVSLLQELTGRFTHCGQERNVELPWLPKQLINDFSTITSEIVKHSLVQQFFRLCLCLPAYLMFKNTPYMLQEHTTLVPIIQFIDEILVPHISEGLFLPASISVYLCQGLSQVSGTISTEEILDEFCHRCPVFMMSLMVNSKLVEPFILPALKEDSPLKYSIEYLRSEECCCSNTVDPWQQAAIFFRMTLDPAYRVRNSIWNKFIQSGPDVAYQYKVCSCLVPMLLLQLTHIQYFQQTEDQIQAKKLESVLTDVMAWIDKEHMAPIYFKDELEEKTILCANERLIKLKNLTVLRFLIDHHGDLGSQQFHSVEFMSGILSAYCHVVTMFDKQGEQLKPLTVDEIQSIDMFLVGLIESASPSILRKGDQELLLSCGPSVADCAIRVLSS